MVRHATGKFARAYCDRCGFDYPLLSLKKEWNNLRVCSECFEPKHPQLEPHKAVDGSALKDARPYETPQQTTVRVRGLTLYVRVLHAAHPHFTVSPLPSGTSATGNIGTVLGSLIAPVTGVSTTGAIGTVTGPVSVSGVSATGVLGTPAYTATAEVGGVYMSGVATIGQIGEENISLSIFETGVSSTTAIGTVSVAVDSSVWGYEGWGDNAWGQ
jgi:hypothetical protein